MHLHSHTHKTHFLFRSYFVTLKREKKRERKWKFNLNTRRMMYSILIYQAFPESGLLSLLNHHLSCIFIFVQLMFRNSNPIISFWLAVCVCMCVCVCTHCMEYTRFEIQTLNSIVLQKKNVFFSSWYKIVGIEFFQTSKWRRKLFLEKKKKMFFHWILCPIFDSW